MRRFAPSSLALAVALAAAVAIAPSALAALRGDDYYRPIDIRRTPFTSRVRTDSYTWTPAEPITSCEPSIDHTVWYRFTPPTTGNYIAETTQSDFSRDPITPQNADTIIGVYTGTVSPSPSFTEVTCDEDSGQAHGGGQYTSWLDISLTGGTTYWFQVGGFGPNEFGDLVFKVYAE